MREVYQTNTGKKILDTATKTGLDAAKTPSKKVLYKTNEATGGELIEKKIAEKIVTPDPAWCEFKKF